MGIAPRVNGAAPPDVPLSEINLGSWDFWALDDDIRDGAFATLRREAPISFHPAFDTEEGFPQGAGHWALTRHDDVFYASRHPELFSSASGIVIGDQTPELAEYFGSMIAMDDPRHTRLRNIVRSAFTPRVLAVIEDSVRDRARRLVAGMVDRNPDGHAELVTELAGPLPLQIICDMMGIPESDHQQIFHWTNVILGFGDPDLTTDFDEFVTVAMDIGAYATALADQRRSAPADDLTTSLVQAEVDGERLTSAEVASFFILLVVAGNETTRNAISHGVLALTRYPEQRRLWWSRFDELAPTAVEEIVRWASPVSYMRRTVTRDTELAGTALPAGPRSRCGTARRTATRRSSTTRGCSTCSAIPIRTWDSAAVAPTSAWAPTSRGARSPCCSPNCTATCPTSSPPRNPTVCNRHSSTASSAFRSRGAEPTARDF